MSQELGERQILRKLSQVECRKGDGRIFLLSFWILRGGERMSGKGAKTLRRGEYTYIAGLS